LRRRDISQLLCRPSKVVEAAIGEGTMECQTKDELEQHLSDIRRLATSRSLTPEESDAAVRAERFAISLLREHDQSGHHGKRCPFATRLE
jgi:hypothetical protein